MLVENNHCCELLLRDAKFCYRNTGSSEDLQRLLPSGLRDTCGSRNGTSSSEPSWRLREACCLDFVRTATNPFESLQINAHVKERMSLIAYWPSGIRVIVTVPLSYPTWREMLIIFWEEAWWIENPGLQEEKALELASEGCTMTSRG